MPVLELARLTLVPCCWYHVDGDRNWNLLIRMSPSAVLSVLTHIHGATNMPVGMSISNIRKHGSISDCFLDPRNAQHVQDRADFSLEHQSLLGLGNKTFRRKICTGKT